MPVMSPVIPVSNMYVKVQALAGAKKERVTRKDNVTYQISVREPAERNMANHRIREIIADEFGLSKGGVKIVSGHRSTSKIFDVILEA